MKRWSKAPDRPGCCSSRRRSSGSRISACSTALRRSGGCRTSGSSLGPITGLACVGVAGVWYLSLRSRSSRDMTGWLALLSLVGILFQGVSLGVLANGA